MKKAKIFSNNILDPIIKRNVEIFIKDKRLLRTEKDMFLSAVTDES